MEGLAPAPDRETNVQTTPQKAETYGDRIRRFFMGEPEDESGPVLDFEPTPRGSNGGTPQAERVVDVRPVTAPDIGTVYLKVQRLETGMHIIARTLKQSHLDLRQTLDELQGMLAPMAAALQLGPPSPTLAAEEVQQIVEKATEPLEDAVNGLAETLHGLPLVVSSATDRLAAMIDTAREDIEANVIALLARPWKGDMSEPPPITGAGEIWNKPA